MARYDTAVVYDDSVIYDATVGVLVDDEIVLAGESPALPARRVVRRDAAATIWGFDSVAWLPTDPLDNVAISATRAGTLSETGRQTETLVFDVSAPLSLDLSEGTWLCVQWTVETTFSDASTASTAFLGGVFRLNSVPSTEQDDAGTAYHCQAIDWFSYLMQYSASASGWLRWADLSAYTADYLADGGVEIPGETDLATWLAAYLWHYASSGTFVLDQAPFHVEPWTGFRPPFINDIAFAPDTGSIAAQITSPGQPCRIADVLAWWWPLVAGYTLAYHADGGLILSGRNPSMSGGYVTLGDTPLSSVPLPAEAAPLSLAPPPYTTVTYQQVFTPADTPPGVEGDFTDPTWLAGTATALYWSGVGGRVERIIDTDHPVTLGGFESATAYCYWRLQGHLGGAQTVSLTVDSAYPPPPLGRLVALQLVAGEDNSWPRFGWWRVTAFSQPLHTGNAVWTLQWWSAS